MEANASKAEAERLLGIAEKLLQDKDFTGSREFAILAQETEPLLDGSDQILAVTDVLLASRRRINNQYDWYAILQLDRRSDDPELIKKQYRRLALLLHPDKNNFAFADSAFRLVAEAWAVLSNAGKKSLYDNELNFFSKADLAASRNQHRRGQDEFLQQQQQQQKLPVRRTTTEAGNSSGGRSDSIGGQTRLSSFWTACPYCYNLYEYPKIYEECCLRCQNCKRAYHAAVIPSPPPMVPGKDSYYCCFGFFPLGFALTDSEGARKAGFPDWTPPQQDAAGEAVPNGGADGFAEVSQPNATPARRKRGRPRKNVQP